MCKDMDAFEMFIKQQLGEEDVELAELICSNYDSGAEARSERVQTSFQRIDQCILGLPFQQADLIRDAVYLACGEYEKLAFLDGVAVGAKLFLELTGKAR